MAKEFLNVELFQVGNWTDSKGRKREWTQKDLDDIANSYNETKNDIHAAIKLGHNDKQALLDGEPAAGWVENIRRIGNRLIGDFMGVPDKIAALIESGAYRARSVELTPDFEVGEKKYNWLLTAVALLGSRLPAVSGLKDIVSLYETSGLELNTEVVLFQAAASNEEEEQEDLAAELQDIFNRLETAIKNRRGAPHVRALQTALNAAIAGTKRSEHEMDTKKMAALLGLSEDASEEDIEKKVKAMAKAEADAKEKAEHSDKEEDDAEKIAYEKRILDLEKRVAVNDATAIVDEAIRKGKLLPKQKETALKMALRDTEEFQAFIESQPDNIIEFGERGQSGNGDINLTKYEPTQTEVAVAKQMGVYDADWRVTLMKNKMAEDGVEIPAGFGEKKDASA